MLKLYSKIKTISHAKLNFKLVVIIIIIIIIISKPHGISFRSNYLTIVVNNTLNIP